MFSTLYNREILRLAASLLPDDRLENPDGTAEVRSPLCGSRITANVEIGADGVIAALALRANACALGQASASIVRSNAAGMSAAEITQIRQSVVDCLNGTGSMPAIWPPLNMLAVARDYRSRHAAILLPYDALLAAIADARKSQAG
jgi:NifU-like protein involved in Fe-S cluster formation